MNDETVPTPAVESAKSKPKRPKREKVRTVILEAIELVGDTYRNPGGIPTDEQAEALRDLLPRLEAEIKARRKNPGSVR